MIKFTFSFPVALEKTHWATDLLVFLGLLLDTKNQVICIPKEKLDKALELLDTLLNKSKGTVLQFQRLCGVLNFLCRCIVPGRAFLRRLYPSRGKQAVLKPYHHMKVTKENKSDMMIWKQFLTHPDVFCHPFLDHEPLVADVIDMWSDASRNFDLGFGSFCGTEWTFGQWPKKFMEVAQPSIEYLELFAVTVAVLNWLKLFKNKKIILFCDNQAVVHMINSNTSSCKNCMCLIRMIVLEGLVQNTRVYANFVGTKINKKADALSRLDFNRFRKCGGDLMNDLPSKIPSQLWPMEKIWISD